MQQGNALFDHLVGELLNSELTGSLWCSASSTIRARRLAKNTSSAIIRALTLASVASLKLFSMSSGLCAWRGYDLYTSVLTSGFNFLEFNGHACIVWIPESGCTSQIRKQFPAKSVRVSQSGQSQDCSDRCASTAKAFSSPMRSKAETVFSMESPLYRSRLCSWQFGRSKRIAPACGRNARSIMPAASTPARAQTQAPHARRTMSGTRCLIEGAPICCIMARVSMRSSSSTRSTPGCPNAPSPQA